MIKHNRLYDIQLNILYDIQLNTLYDIKLNTLYYILYKIIGGHKIYKRLYEKEYKIM